MFLCSPAFGFDQKPQLGKQINWGHPLAQGLLGCWVMNERGGKIFDLSGNGNDGTLKNGAYWVTTQGGPGIYMDGVNDYISFSWSKLGLTGFPFTIVQMGKHYINEASNSVIFSDNNAEKNSFVVYVNSDNNGYAAQYGDSGFQKAVSAGTVADNEEYFLAGVFKTDTDRWAYLNNEAGVQNTDDSGTFTWGNIDRFNVGMLDREDDVWYESKGFKFLAIYNRALTPSEIAWLYREPYVMFKDIPIHIRYNPSGGSPAPAPQIIIIGKNKKHKSLEVGNVIYPLKFWEEKPKEDIYKICVNY